MFTNGRSEVADFFRRWLVGELAAGVRVVLYYKSFSASYCSNSFEYEVNRSVRRVRATNCLYMLCNCNELY